MLACITWMEDRIARSGDVRSFKDGSLTLPEHPGSDLVGAPEKKALCRRHGFSVHGEKQWQLPKPAGQLVV